MMLKICAWCGKEFESLNNKKYCPGPHYSKCEVCGDMFLVTDVSIPHRTCSAACKSLLRKQAISKKVKICELCGKEFTSTSNTARYCPGPHYQPCPVCGKPVRIMYTYNPAACCSTECSNKLRENTCLATYGVRTASQSPEARAKLKEQAILSAQSRVAAVQKHYGEEYTNVSQVPEIKEKIRSSVTSKECIEHTQDTNMARYGVRYAMQHPELRSKQSRNSKNRSQLELRSRNMLAAYNVSYEEMHVVSDGKVSHEFDFYLPDYKILIDCDGVYWHSYLDDPDGTKVRDDYDTVRLSLIPKDHIFCLIVETDFERGLRNLQKIIKSIDDNIFDYDSELFNWCRSIEFPYPCYSEDRMLKEYNKLCDYNIDSYNPYCKVGISIVRHFHPSIYRCNVSGHVSPIEAWNSDKMLKRVIANRLIYQNDVDPSKILSGFNISKIAPKVSVFNPVLARYLVQKYLSDYSTVFDPFSGFSGRLLGVCSAGKQYIGQDIRPESVSESKAIIQFLNLQAQVILADSTQTQGQYECLLTCPPYADTEIYLDDMEVQSCDAWINMCLNNYSCSRYVFVINDTAQYKDNIVEELPCKSHFRHDSEYVVVINK